MSGNGIGKAITRAAQQSVGVALLARGAETLASAAAELAAGPAGFAGPPKLGEITGDFFHAERDIKVMGYVRGAREGVEGMRAQGSGRIVNVNGLAARLPATPSAACATSRWPR